ncbi:hypothetical protein C8R42DRAFT_642909 [Lentinula raphanica]|nr:hypothetical protein C8R42DRAFT_642909 [Lentinula raphanica]
MASQLAVFGSESCRNGRTSRPNRSLIPSTTLKGSILCTSFTLLPQIFAEQQHLPFITIDFISTLSDLFNSFNLTSDNGKPPFFSIVTNLGASAVGDEVLRQTSDSMFSMSENTYRNLLVFCKPAVCVEENHSSIAYQSFKDVSILNKTCNE